MTQPVPEVVVTGVGVISPIGMGCDSFWESLIACRSGIRPIGCNTGTLPYRYAGELADFDAKRYVKPRKAIKMMCRETQVGQAAAILAFDDAGLKPERLEAERFGIVFGSDMLYGHPTTLRDVYVDTRDGDSVSYRKWGERFPHDMFPLWLLLYLPNMVACHAAIALDARGPNNTVVQGGASGLLAMIEAASYIERGWADVMLTGSVGSTVNPTRQVYLTHEHLSRHSDGERACRPFDSTRDGAVVGEGGAALMLESREHAMKRGARVYASIAGIGRTVGLSTDRFLGATTEAIRQSIRLALEGRPWMPQPKGELQHVNANGLGTVDDDRREGQAIHTELGNVPVTAPKSYFGDLGAGAAAVELVVSVLALHHGTVPPTLNYSTPDATCPVSVVCDRPLARDKPLALALNQSTTGHAAAITLRAEPSS